MLLLLGVAVAENQATWPQSLKLTERAVSFGMEKRDGLGSAVLVLSRICLLTAELRIRNMTSNT